MKLFFAEPGSDNMVRFYGSEDDLNKIVSAITPVEARSAIYRVKRRRLLTAKQASSAMDRLAVEMGRIVHQPIDALVLEIASLMIDRHQLKSLDAIQLACAIVARDFCSRSGMRFVTSDKELLEAALKEGFEVWDPSA